MAEHSVMESIARLVPPGSRVPDLGCGDGALLAHLQATRACTGYGVEIDDAKVPKLSSAAGFIVTKKTLSVSLEQGL